MRPAIRLIAINGKPAARHARASVRYANASRLLSFSCVMSFRDGRQPHHPMYCASRRARLRKISGVGQIWSFRFIVLFLNVFARRDAACGSSFMLTSGSAFPRRARFVARGRSRRGVLPGRAKFVSLMAISAARPLGGMRAAAPLLRTKSFSIRTRAFSFFVASCMARRSTRGVRTTSIAASMRSCCSAVSGRRFSTRSVSGKSGKSS